VARRHTSVLLAAIIVIARIVGGGAPARAATTTSSEESVRAEIGHNSAPSRKVRSLAGTHARIAACNEAIGPWIESLPIVVEDPPRTLVPPTVRPPVEQIVALPAPATRARAPPH
jgi:hypothetical protein